MAYLAWILGASTAVSGMTGWRQATISTILMAAVLFIPVLDQLCDTAPADAVPARKRAHRSWWRSLMHMT